MTSEASSPIGRLAAYVPTLFTRVAPERANDLSPLIAGLTVVTIPGPGFPFAAYHGERAITVSWRGLEYLWCLAYSAWTLLDVYGDVEQQALEFDLQSRPATAPIPSLLPWALSNQHKSGGGYTPWPAGHPTPTMLQHGSGRPPTDTDVASEICLAATGWVMHHELAHLSSGHITQAFTSVQDEAAADAAATSWILDRAPPEDLIRRAAGIAAATIGLAGLRLALPIQSMGPRTHPHPADRIMASLGTAQLAGHDALHAMAAVQLSLHMRASGISPTATEFDTAQECLQCYCLDLKRLRPAL